MNKNDQYYTSQMVKNRKQEEHAVQIWFNFPAGCNIKSDLLLLKQPVFLLSVHEGLEHRLENEKIIPAKRFKWPIGNHTWYVIEGIIANLRPETQSKLCID